jgi:hypothetical protein
MMNKRPSLMRAWSPVRSQPSSVIARSVSCGRYQYPRMTLGART